MPDSVYVGVISYSNYFSFGMLAVDRHHSVDSFRFGFNSQEKTDEIAESGNHYTAPFWEYDPRTVHRWNQDPRPNPSFSPYTIMQGNPIYYVDILGDSINVSSAVARDEAEGTNYTQDIIKDWEEQTGLNISTNENNNLVFETDDEGNPVIARDEEGNLVGSQKARDLIKGAIGHKQTVSLFLTSGKGSKGQGLSLGVDPEQVQEFISGTSSDLNKKTLGFGMTAMHELLHTDVAGSLSDRTSAFDAQGPTVRQMNVVRNQLGQDYGQRFSYKTFILSNDRAYIPFTPQAKDLIDMGRIPSQGVIKLNPR